MMSRSSCLVLVLFAINFSVSVSEANYEFTVRFYEFRNPPGLQCGECGSGGPPACCDDVQQKESCTSVAPRGCDTGFRFLLRPFGASVETAPTGGFPHFTPSNGGNSELFNEGPHGFLALSNPFTITNASEWTGRIQFFIDALDRIRQSGETEVLINRFLINLELELGAAFTERTTYTGIYNISGLGFDMSFRVQCSENYYGPNCATFCVPIKDLYICDSVGSVICVHSDLNPVTNCTVQNTNSCSVMPGLLGGILGLSIIFLIIIVVALVAKNRASSPSLPVPPSSAVNEGGGNQGTLDIEMNPNSLYGLTSDGIVTEPNEVYGVMAPAEPSQPETYEYLM